MRGSEGGSLHSVGSELHPTPEHDVRIAAIKEKTHTATAQRSTSTSHPYPYNGPPPSST